ncbi:hypothetical protein [Kribbella shirazensis]|uniref:Uncharacterized protein n=1 Tax=Kribbella shirazensis TaxID=1105143 RepID=A0A7X6A1N2_9ACTN|nr:hypothetical protein [Kribbella shirazensis]NIK58386.1 hypothetical protein [Kribbella shirazensis]
MIHIVRDIMNVTRYRRRSAGLLLTVVVMLGAATTVGLVSGGEGALILLLGLRKCVPLLGSLALAALTGAVLLGLRGSTLRVPLVTMLLVVGAPTLLLGGAIHEVTITPDGRPDRVVSVG